MESNNDLTQAQERRNAASAHVDNVVSENSHGDKGDRGDPGAAGWSDRRMLFLVCFVLFISLVLAWRSQLSDDGIKRNTNNMRVISYSQCQVNNRNATAISKLIDSLIVAVTNTKTLPQTEKDRRIATYQAARPLQQPCTK